MRKLPYMQFYVADYQADTRCLSLAARGAWMDILCCLWRAPKRGQRTLSLEGWAGEIGKSVAEVTPLLAEIRSNDMGVFCDEIDSKLTICSRRMLREERIRRGATTRKQHQRDRRLSCLSHASITAVSPPSHREISEIRSQSQKSEVRHQKSEIKVSSQKSELGKEAKKKSCEGGQPLAAKARAAAESKSAPAWWAYVAAYRTVYAVEPVRNAKTNAQMAAFVSRVPLAEAPAVAAFYVRHKNKFYVLKRHPVGLLLQDAEGLYTQWKTKRSVTASQAAQIDKTAGALNVFQEVKDELYGKETTHEQAHHGHADDCVRIDGDGIVQAHGEAMA